jgi:hypothetical protein
MWKFNMISRSLGTTTFNLRSRIPRRSRSRIEPAARVADMPVVPQAGLLALCFLSIAIIVASIVWYFELSRPLACHPSPLFFRFGNDIETSITVNPNMRCPVYVMPGEIAFDDVVVTAQPQHGTVLPRGHIGVYYRSEVHFRGDDYFAFRLTGTAGSRSGTMAIRVKVHVQ